MSDGKYDLVVFDTWSKVSPVQDENDAAQTNAAVAPLQAITEAGAAVLIIHHSSKKAGFEGTACRGSSALAGSVDVIMDFRKCDAKRLDDRRRVINGLSRYDATPGEVVIELTDRGFVVLGDRAEASQAERIEQEKLILDATDDPMTAKDVHNAWFGEIAKPGLRTVENDLAHAHQSGKIDRVGEGKRGSPFRYHIRDP